MLDKILKRYERAVTAEPEHRRKALKRGKRQLTEAVTAADSPVEAEVAATLLRSLEELARREKRRSIYQEQAKEGGAIS